MSSIGDERDLWNKLRQHGCQEARQELLLRYIPWARSVAKGVYRRVRIVQLDWNDYAQNATVGLLEAMGRFDPDRGVDFMAYAKPRVRGAVFNALRAYLSEARNGGSLSDRYRERLDSLRSTNPDSLLEETIAVVTGLGVGFLLDSDATNTDLSRTLSDASTMAEQTQLEARLSEAIEALPDREALIMRLHYYEHLPFTRIAEILGLTKGRISQLHKAAIERIRQNTWVSDIQAVA